MTNRFTPGPWAVYEMDGSIGTVEAADGSMVAQAQMCGTLRAPDNDRRKANARLIAAAPDLLYALQYARNLIGPDSVLDGAIAKATGVKQ